MMNSNTKQIYNSNIVSSLQNISITYVERNITKRPYNEIYQIATPVRMREYIRRIYHVKCNPQEF